MIPKEQLQPKADKMNEVWLTVPGFAGYEASNLGNIRSLDRFIVYRNRGSRTHKGKMIKLYVTPYGYFTISLKGRSTFVHRLVAQAFIPNPENKPFVNHINANKKDNRVSNLEWCTREENEKHATDNNLKYSQPGILNPMAKLSEESVKKIIKLIDLGVTQRKIAKEYNVSPATICLINKGINWASLRTQD